MTEKTTANRGFRALADAQRALPKPQTATLAEGDVEYVVSGEGGPAVVLLSSFGVPHPAWALIWGELTATTTVFAYNRLGVGASGPAQHPQTGTAVVDTLRKTLAASGPEAPYVIVAHALGGLFAQLYARRFPQEVAGLVLVEATHPDDDVLERRLRFLPRAVAGALTSRAVRRGVRRYSELRYFEQTVAEVGAAGPFPDTPLTVVTGGRAPSRLTTSPAQAQRHDQRQRELVALSPQGTQMMAPHSAHLPQITDPEVVVQAVRNVLGR